MSHGVYSNSQTLYFSYPCGNGGPPCFRLGHLGFKETGPTGHQALELIFSPEVHSSISVT